MGLLDSLNPINLAKNAAESIVDSVLPDSLKAVGNDLVDVALDVVSGNYSGLGKDVGSFLHDAETLMAPLTNPATSLPSSSTEPDAPPPADGKKTSSTKSSDAQSGTKSSGTKSSGTKSSGTEPSTSSTSTGTSAGAGETAPTTTPVVTEGGGSKSTTPSSTDSKSTADSKSTTKSSSSTSKSSAASDAKDVTKFFAQSDTELMAAIRDGKLPDAVKDDPAAMQRLQLRMNEISEMNQLISQMLAAMHDMNKAVIQNIRA